MKDSKRLDAIEKDIKLIGLSLEAIHEALTILRDRLQVQEMR